MILAGNSVYTTTRKLNS